VTVCVYAVPTVPRGKGSAGARLIVAQLTVRWYTWLPLQPNASVAKTVNVARPSAVGVPLISPELLRVSPLGKLPLLTLYVYGPVPPLALTV
jgi:hypothetical protein